MIRFKKFSWLYVEVIILTSYCLIILCIKKPTQRNINRYLPYVHLSEVKDSDVLSKQTFPWKTYQASFLSTISDTASVQNNDEYDCYNIYNMTVKHTAKIQGYNVTSELKDNKCNEISDSTLNLFDRDNQLPFIDSDLFLIKQLCI